MTETKAIKELGDAIEMVQRAAIIAYGDESDNKYVPNKDELQLFMKLAKEFARNQQFVQDMCYTMVGRFQDGR